MRSSTSTIDARYAAMDVPGDPAHQRQMLADQRLGIALRRGRGHRSAARMRENAMSFIPRRASGHAASASGAPITATTSTAFSSGTSKKLITGVSGRHGLDQFADREADRRLDDERERLGLGDQRPGGVLQRVDDAAAEIGLDRVAARRVGADRLAEQRLRAGLRASSRAAARARRTACWMISAPRSGRISLDDLLGVERLLRGDGDRGGDAAEFLERQFLRRAARAAPASAWSAAAAAGESAATSCGARFLEPVEQRLDFVGAEQIGGVLAQLRG